MANPFEMIVSTLRLLRGADRKTVFNAGFYFFNKLRLDSRYGKHHAEGTFQKPGAMLSVEKHERGIIVTCAHGVMRISVIASDCMQVRFQPSGKFQVPFSYAVAKVTWPTIQFSMTETDHAIILTAPEISCQVSRDNGMLTFKDVRGNVISHETEGIAYREGEIRWSRQLPHDELCLGLAEQPVNLDLRGKRYLTWNSDPLVYDRDTKGVHFTIPFYLGTHSDHAVGLFWDNSSRGWVDVGAEHHDQITFSSATGELRYYIFAGADVKSILGRYTELTGRMPMPPIWALGFHISRWSYFPADKVREIAAEFRHRKIPCDAIYLDIHYMDGYRCFTWDRERFPAPALLLGELADQGFKPIAILDPGIKVDSKYEVYQSGLREDVFVKNANGKPFVGPVWPGPSVFPDFTSAKARAWWSTQIAGLVKTGVVGLWNDMNEPVVFNATSEKELPDSARHDFDGVGATHLEAHNVYGMLMGRASREGLEKYRPGKRPFNIIRAAHAGAQRYASAWTGDNRSTWDHMKLNISMVINSGLSGVAFTGSDVGGFSGHAEPELLVRWIQLGAMMPFFRVHTAFDTVSQEPWAFGQPYEDIARRYIELRYELLPYFYSVFAQNSQYGWPIIRPMFMIDPADINLRAIEDSFMVGDSLLCAPIMHKGQRERELYLPRGNWFDFHTNQPYRGGQVIKVAAPLETMPIFARAGHVIPLWPVQQYVGQVPLKELRLKVYAGDGETTVYEDAGENLEYMNGVFRWLYFTCKVLPNGAQQIAWRQAGKYIPPYSAVRCEVYGIQFEPKNVELDGRSAPLWYYEKNIVEFTANKPFENARIIGE